MVMTRINTRKVTHLRGASSSAVETFHEREIRTVLLLRTCPFETSTARFVENGPQLAPCPMLRFPFCRMHRLYKGYDCQQMLQFPDIQRAHLCHFKSQNASNHRSLRPEQIT